MTNENKLWTDEDELGFKIGDMHGEWEKRDVDSKIPPKPVEKPFTKTPTKPVLVIRLPENLKKHIKRDGRK